MSETTREVETNETPWAAGKVGTGVVTQPIRGEQRVRGNASHDITAGEEGGFNPHPYTAHARTRGHVQEVLKLHLVVPIREYGNHPFSKRVALELVHLQYSTGWHHPRLRILVVHWIGDGIFRLWTDRVHHIQNRTETKTRIDQRAWVVQETSEPAFGGVEPRGCS